MEKKNPNANAKDEDDRKEDLTNRCPECQSGHLVRDYERGELVCEMCGLVIDDQFIDMRKPSFLPEIVFNKHRTETDDG